MWCLLVLVVVGSPIYTNLSRNQELTRVPHLHQYRYWSIDGHVIQIRVISQPWKFYWNNWEMAFYLIWDYYCKSDVSLELLVIIFTWEWNWHKGISSLELEKETCYLHSWILLCWNGSPLPVSVQWCNNWGRGCKLFWSSIIYKWKNLTEIITNGQPWWIYFRGPLSPILIQWH